MDSKDIQGNKDSGLTQGSHYPAQTGRRPIKKCHCVEGKHFIVFDESIVQRAGITDDELYFLQEITDDGRIILSPYRVKEHNDVQHQDPHSSQ